MQPIYLVKVLAARKPSDVAKSPRKRARNKFIQKVRDLTSGGSASKTVDASEAQLASELKTLPRRSKVKVCEQAGIKQRCRVTKEVGLMMKSHLKLTWSQKRKLTRVLKTLGVTSESELAQRELRKSLLGDHLDGCNMVFEFKDDEDPYSISGIVSRKAPCVFIKSLPTFVTEYLDKYDATIS